jgi:hypothetical protein
MVDRLDRYRNLANEVQRPGRKEPKQNEVRRPEAVRQGQKPEYVRPWRNPSPIHRDQDSSRKPGENTEDNG